MEYLTYTPAYEGNRESGTPFTVEIKLLSRGQITAYSGMISVEPVDGFRNKTKNNMAKIQTRQFLENVGDIIGLTDDITGQEITTAQELYEAPGFEPLATEIIGAMEDRSKISEGLAKNLKPQSDTGTKTRKSGAQAKIAKIV